MEKYLMMSDVFKSELFIDSDCDDVIVDDLSITVLESFSGSDAAKFALHAIKSHDELVQMNQELLAALEDAATSLETIQLRSFGEDSFLDSKPEMRSYAGSRASVVRAAIAKAKGGAA